MSNSSNLKISAILWGMFIVLIIGCIWATIHALGPSDHKGYQKVVVENGDTLWGIAKNYGKDEQSEIVHFVSWVEKENRLQGDHIKAGETIVIPVKKETNMIASD